MASRDVLLDAVIAAAEAGEECALLHVLVGGWWVSGTPMSETQYVEVVTDRLLHLEEEGGLLGRRKEPRDVPQTLVRRLEDAESPEGEPWLHLSVVHAGNDAGAGLETEAVRIDPAAVTAWTFLPLDALPARPGSARFVGGPVLGT